MASGKNSKNGARYQPVPETPVRNRLRQIIAVQMATPEARPATPPTIVDENTVQQSVLNNLSNRFSIDALGDDLPARSTDATPTPEKPTPLSKKARKALRAREKQATENGPYTPTDPLPSLDSGSPFGDDSTALRTASLPSTDGNGYPFPPIKNMCDNFESGFLSKSVEKRDSVISSDWEDTKIERPWQATAKKGSRGFTWSSKLKLKTWWPYRMYLSMRIFLLAVIKGFQGPRKFDFIITFGFLLVCCYAAYTTLDFIFTGLIKGANAQALVEAANCSVVYVTIPGPIITVSLIAASPTNPAQGTYYYSVVSGSTEWLNSVAPPSRPGLSITRTSIPLPIDSTLPGLESSMQPSPSPTMPVLLTSLPPGVGTTLTSTITSGDMVIISTMILVPSSMLPPPTSPTSLLASSTSSSTASVIA
ncbi:uncharacterized protein M421DRAFT_2546 [Didymella exigua CBS 183.55]|uniref:Uncharacterized protein n=1 Tax=Didymella exigua CBS 183.55 TaxID=1150837 RepID=A0A6A5RTZ3_9PLEO|nr:uncharacterized protein M421DRAFT_2546 [Didymella exigua CBS 183.55]KAF1931935.1 hypothetical protein M421DRAFT_2546 [Didymella exigua CBS 183.55]